MSSCRHAILALAVWAMFGTAARAQEGCASVRAGQSGYWEVYNSCNDDVYFSIRSLSCGDPSALFLTTAINPNFGYGQPTTIANDCDFSVVRACLWNDDQNGNCRVD